MHHVQSEYYDQEIKILKRGSQLPETFCILRLRPFLDREGVLRVGGRLTRAEMPYGTRHRCLIPGKHRFATILVDYYHRETRHQGKHITTSKVQQAGYHITEFGSIVKGVVSSCVNCLKLRGDFATQLMADLPPVRTTPSAPFRLVGIDVFGPFYVSNGKQTRATQGKAKVWALIIVCLPSRAIHLEPLVDLSTDAFLCALARFTAIRGIILIG